MRFSYVKYDSDLAEKQTEFKEAFEHLERLGMTYLPEGRYRSLYITKLEEAYMWTGKSLRDEQIRRDGEVREMAERGDV